MHSEHNVKFWCNSITMKVLLYLNNIIKAVFFIIPKESVVFILKYFLSFISAAIVVCSESIQMYVDCTAHTHNTSDSSENTRKSIHFLITPNETAIITDVMFENIILQWIILKCVRWKVIKLCLCSNWTVYVKHDMKRAAIGRMCVKLFGGQKGGVASGACCEDWNMSQVTDEVKQLCSSTKTENWVVVCIYSLFPYFIYFLWLLGISQVQGGHISCEGWDPEELL
jgi:hypothetical protein